MAVIHTIDNNRITARNMLVEGDIHITCNLSLVDYPTTTEIINNPTRIELIVMSFKFMIHLSGLFSKL